jgi:hypothetical protein
MSKQTENTPLNKVIDAAKKEETNLSLKPELDEKNFVNENLSDEKSQDVYDALARLLKSIPMSILKTTIANYIQFVNMYIEKVFEKVGIELTKPIQPQMENSVDIARKISMIGAEVMTDPVIQAQIQRVFASYEILLREILKRMMGLIWERVEEGVDKGTAVYEKATTKVGNATLNAIQSLIPGAGNVIGIIRSIHAFVINMQEINHEGMKFFTNTMTKLLVILNKVSIPGLDALDGSITAFVAARKAYDKALSKIDGLSAKLEQGNKLVGELDKMSEKIENGKVGAADVGAKALSNVPEIPKVPEIKAPEIKAPEIKAPEIPKVPQIK